MVHSHPKKYLLNFIFLIFDYDLSNFFISMFFRMKDRSSGYITSYDNYLFKFYHLTLFKQNITFSS